jgi:hypothetical protein
MSKSPKHTGGPVVKTGPTAGKNRSRNKDGSWRKKRNDSGKSKKSGGCFLTTAACEFRGLEDECHELQTLRLFRDRYLLSSAVGVKLIDEYYVLAPKIIDAWDANAELPKVWETVNACVEHIDNGEPQEALRRYREMINGLTEKYNVRFN